MDDRAEMLRRRIELHRCYLAAGASDLKIIRVFLKAIAADQAELAEIERRSNKLKMPAGEA